MGFIDYAWTISFQKDNTKVKILQDPNIEQPTFFSPTNFGITIKLPSVKFLPNKQISYLGQVFPFDHKAKSELDDYFARQFCI